MYINVSDIAQALLVGAIIVWAIRTDLHWFAVLVIFGGLYFFGTFNHVP